MSNHKINSKLTYLPIIVFFLLSCAPKVISNQSATVGTFRDNDINDFRPEYTLEGTAKTETPEKKPSSGAASAQPAGGPSGDITARLNAVLDTIAIRNRTIRFAQGYRVQIYTGTSREEATQARNRSYAKFPDITPHFDYAQPNFRVRVGDFLDRLEAQRVYAGLIAEFPNALIVPDRIEIR